MLTAVDTAALSNSGLRPDARGSMAASLALRPAIVATATYATYAAGFDGHLLSYTFPPNTLSPGNQVRVRLFGTVNGGHGPNTFLPSLRIVQQAQSDAVTTIWQVNDGLIAWEVDSVLTVSAPLQSDPATNARPVIGSANPRTSCPVLVVGGMQRLILTDSTATGGVTAGGVIQTTPGDTTQSYLIASTNPNDNLQLEAGLPVAVTLDMLSDADFTVQGGWMEAL